jgi:hypothetical protein
MQILEDTSRTVGNFFHSVFPAFKAVAIFHSFLSKLPEQVAVSTQTIKASSRILLDYAVLLADDHLERAELSKPLKHVFDSFAKVRGKLDKIVNLIKKNIVGDGQQPPTFWRRTVSFWIFPRKLSGLCGQFSNACEIMVEEMTTNLYLSSVASVKQNLKDMCMIVFEFSEKNVKYGHNPYIPHIPTYVTQDFQIFKTSSKTDLLKNYRKMEESSAYITLIKQRTSRFKQDLLCENVVRIEFPKDGGDLRDYVWLLTGVDDLLINFIHAQTAPVSRAQRTKWCIDVGNAFLAFHSQGWLLRLQSLENLYILEGTVKVEAPFCISEKEISERHKESAEYVYFNRLEEICWQADDLNVVCANAATDLHFYGAVIYVLFTMHFPYRRDGITWEDLLARLPPQDKHVREAIELCVYAERQGKKTTDSTIEILNQVISKFSS